MKWTCPECKRDFELEEDGSIKIFPLNRYFIIGSCKLCGRKVPVEMPPVIDPEVSNVQEDKQHILEDLLRRPYPANPHMNEVCVYAGPAYPFWGDVTYTEK